MLPPATLSDAPGTFPGRSRDAPGRSRDPGSAQLGFRPGSAQLGIPGSSRDAGSAQLRFRPGSAQLGTPGSSQDAPGMLPDAPGTLPGCSRDFPGCIWRLKAVQNTSPNAPLSRISRFRCLKCKRGAHFRIAKRTPVEDFAFQMSKMQARCSFSYRQTNPYLGFLISDV